MTLNKHEWVGLGIVAGAVIGAVIGSATHQMGAWLPIGAGIGTAIANGIADRTCAANPRRSESRASSSKLVARS